jgi:hypothetical protein
MLYCEYPPIEAYTKLSTAETFDVFVSYTHADASAVKPLVEALRGQD